MSQPLRLSVIYFTLVVDEKLVHTSPPVLDCILLLSTSAGAQTVVATVPAASEASVWVMISSLLLIDLRTKPFADEYVAIWETSTQFSMPLLNTSTDSGLTH